MFRGRAERDGVQNSTTLGLLHGDFAGQKRLWSKIPGITNADAAGVALLSRMEAGARPERGAAAGIQGDPSLFENTGGSARPAFQILSANRVGNR